MPRLSLFLFPFLFGCASGSRANWNAAKTASPPMTLDLTVDDSSREVPLKGVRNARDLAGLPGKNGPIPPDHFLRTANLSRITEDDRKVLLDHHVKLILDLRTVWERSIAPDPLSRDSRFHYAHVSLMGVGAFDSLYSKSHYGALYVHALHEHQGDFRAIFHQLASEKDGAVLFHCTSGKDRTGMVSAMLLDLAGVGHDDIVHNYAITRHYLHPDPQDAERFVEDAPPEAIDQFLHELDSQYGGARNYLKTVGLDDDDLSTLLDRLGQSSKPPS